MGKFVLGTRGSTTPGDDGMLSKTSINNNMRILYVSPKELKINPLNQKYFSPLPEEEYNKLKQNIQETGIQDPLQVKKDGTILAGENRFNIAIELNLKLIPIVYKDFQDEQEEIKFIIGDNLLRRHLTLEEKKKLLFELYGEQILKPIKRGGDKRSSQAINNQKTYLAEQISDETGLKIKAVEKYLAQIRKEKKGKIKKDSTVSPVIFLKRQVDKMQKITSKIKLEKLKPEEVGEISDIKQKLADIIEKL